MIAVIGLAEPPEPPKNPDLTPGDDPWCPTDSCPPCDTSPEGEGQGDPRGPGNGGGCKSCEEVASDIDVTAKSLHVKISLGGALKPGSKAGGYLLIHEEKPSAMLATPQALKYSSRPALTHVRPEPLPPGVYLPTVEHPKTVTAQLRSGRTVNFAIPGSSALGYPTGQSVGAPIRIIKVDEAGERTTGEPHAYRLMYDGARDMYDEFPAVPDDSGGYGLTGSFGPAMPAVQPPSDVVYTESGELSQILAPKCFVDIETTSGLSYNINFYPRSGAGPKVDGFFTPQGDTFASIEVRNPSPGNTDRLKIVRRAGEEERIYTIKYNGNLNQWEVAVEDSERVYAAYNILNTQGDERLQVLETRDRQNRVHFARERLWRTFSWGEAMVSSVVDAEGIALPTTRDYYESDDDHRYSLLKERTNPNGSWETYDYDGEKRRTKRTRPYGNSASGMTGAVHEVISYTYNAADEADLRPQDVTRTLLGIPVEKTFTRREVVGGQYRTIVERGTTPDAEYGDAENQRTVTVHYPAGGDPISAGKHFYRDEPDGRRVTWTYAAGSYTPHTDPAQCSFTSGSGDAHQVITTHGTTSNPEGVAGKTLRTTETWDGSGNNVLSETMVYTGTDYQRIGWIVRQYDTMGHITSETASSGLQKTIAWGTGCCGKESETDSSGLTTAYTYDVLDQVEIVDRELGDGNVITAYTYDINGRRLSTTVTAGGIVQASSNRYDTAGRLLAATDPRGIETLYEYAENGRSTTVIRAGITNVTVKYLDGRTHYTEQSGVRKQTYTYGVNTNGTQWTMVYTGPAGTNSPVWTKTTTDMLGRTVKTERPGYGGTTIVTEQTYNALGRLVKTTRTGSAATLYAYDALGNQTTSAHDRNGNGQIDLAGPDRVTAQYRSYETYQSYWYRVATSVLYPEDGSATPVTNSISKTRLTGLGTASALGTLTAESTATDIHGNETVSQRYVDRAAKTVTQVTDTPDSTNDAMTVTVNGLVQSVESKTGVTASYGYDPIGRRTSMTDGRDNTSITAYNDKGQVAYTEDAASNRTSYAYNAAGRRIAITNALGEVTRYHHSAEGQLLATWGNVYPVFYEYDVYDRMTAMYTLRDDSVTLASFADFCSNISSFDKTTWMYDEATGLLTEKLYADNQGPTYTYTADGKLETRTWARGIVTTYGYDNCCGALTNISYSDNTPSVSFSYNRMGQQDTITDATGNRTFTYNDALQLASETNALAALSRTHDGLGRPAGYELTTGGTASTRSEYGYDLVGRFNSLQSSVNGLQTNVFNYSHVPGTDLIAGYSGPGSLSVARTYEDERNLIASVSNQWGASTISSFAYQNDALGRRTERIDTLAVTNTFGYNSRSEVTSAEMGSDTYSYDYDPIGNRTSASNSAAELTYLSNELNQYTNVANGVTDAPTYDADGNILTYGGWTFAWDGENRLINASNSSTVIENAYDYMGRRFQKIVNGVTNTFLYDGWAMIREESTTTTNHYVYGLDLSGSMQGAGTIGGILTADLNGTTAFYCYDANGNVTDLVDTNGSTVAHYEYDPFGNTTVKTGALADSNPFRLST